jgi:hypothetical protein
MSRTDLSEDGAVLVSTLTAPERGLAAAADRRRPLTALLLATLLSLVFTAVALPRLDFEGAATAALGNGGPGAEELTPHQQEEALVQARKLGGIAGWANAAAGPTLLVLGAAFALFLAFRLAGTKPGFKATLAVSAHALLPLFVAQLLLLPALVQQAPVLPSELPRLLPSSLAALLPAQASPIAAAAASSLDLFTAWTVVLLVLGMAHAAGSTRLRAAVVVGLLWLAQIGVLKIAPAAAIAARLHGGA